MMVDVDGSAGVALRWLRALLLGTVALSAGVAGHLGADGLMPGRTAVAVLFVVCVCGAALFLGRPASRLRVVMLLIAGQTFIHGALTALAGHRGDPPLVRPGVPVQVPDFRTASGGAHRVGSLMDQFYAQQQAGQRVALSLPYPVQHLLADLTGQHALMAVGHLAAAVVVGLWLATGERALWSLLTLTLDLTARVIVPVLRRWLAAIGAVHVVATWAEPRRVRSPVESAARPLAEHLASASVVRRGPPAPVAA